MKESDGECEIIVESYQIYTHFLSRQCDKKII